MKLKIKNLTFEFKKIPINIIKKGLTSIFYNKNNKTLRQTFEHYKYSQLRDLLEDKYRSYLDYKLGDFLKILKESNDKNYLYFLNKYGDNEFCEFKINESLSDRGIYVYVIDNNIKYVGRCTDNFNKRINQGYGKIHPKNCFIDGQATNCHLNSLINSVENVTLGIYAMNDKSLEEIKEMEKTILKSYKYDWNIQTS